MGTNCKKILNIFVLIITLIFILNIKLYATTTNEEDLLDSDNIIEESETFESENIVINNEDDLTSGTTNDSSDENKNGFWTTKLKAIVILINIILTIFFVYRIKRCMENRKIVNEKYSRKYKVKEFKYFKDIPNEENATPSRAWYLTYFDKSDSNRGQLLGEIFPATILDLSLKGLVGFEVIKKDDVKIFTFNRKDVVLSKDEQIVYDLLADAIYASEKEYITTRELYSFIIKNRRELLLEFSKMYKWLEEDDIFLENINVDIKKFRNKLQREHFIYMVISLVLGFTVILPFIILIPYLCMIFCIFVLNKNLKNIEILSQSGRQEEICWKGLKMYLEEYTLVNNDIPKDANLLEKYLVYATTFGILENFIKQLQIVNFEIQNIKIEKNIITSGKTNVNLGFLHLVANEIFGFEGFLKTTSRLKHMYDENLIYGGK